MMDAGVGRLSSKVCLACDSSEVGAVDGNRDAVARARG